MNNLCRTLGHDFVWMGTSSATPPTLAVCRRCGAKVTR